jgi:ABC-type uncharacterized transport system permease subunit
MKKYIFYFFILIGIFLLDIILFNRTLWKSSFSCNILTICNFFTTLQFATPLMLLGISYIVSIKSNLFNLGQEGQMYLGMITAAYLGYWVSLPDNVHSIVIAIGAIIVGGIYGWFAGWLKIRLGINEIISTIILSEIIINFPLQNFIKIPYFARIENSAKFLVFAPGSKFGTGFVIAVSAVVIVYIYLWKSGKGYEQRMSGEAPRFAFFGGIKSEKAALRGMFISGGLAGLAGAIEVMGVHYRVVSLPIVFDGLLISYLSLLNPIILMFNSVLIAGLRNGFQLSFQYNLGINREIGSIFLIIVMLLIVKNNFFKSK